VLGWPKRCKLAHAFLWEYSCNSLKLAQLLGGVLTWWMRAREQAERASTNVARSPAARAIATACLVPFIVMFSIGPSPGQYCHFGSQ
jgi:hypothetical protein